MNKTTLYEEYRLIERSENEISIAWKGAHLLLFFLAFVFGSFCTFCFHVLMYMFDQKCVLYPTLYKHPSLRHAVLEYLSVTLERPDPPDGEPSIEYINIRWVDDNLCFLPTYVPLVSGLFGLVWTIMYLMCSSGFSNPTGMQRQWRALPLIFIFSVAMGAVCVYASSITNNGLRDLCAKLAQVTGSTSCTYTVNVVSLSYERRIRGVYQATQLTIISAWLHTCCWLLSALTTLLRVLFAVDFQLVCVRADLIGNVDRMLEKYEKQIRFVTPGSTGRNSTVTMLSDSVTSQSITNIHREKNVESELSLLPEEKFKLSRYKAYERVPKNRRFIVKMLYDILENIHLPYSSIDYDMRVESELLEPSLISPQKGREDITASGTPVTPETVELKESDTSIYRSGKPSTTASLKTKVPMKSSESPSRRVQILDVSNSTESMKANKSIKSSEEKDTSNDKKQKENKKEKTNTGTEVNKLLIDKESQIKKEKQD